MYTNADIQKTQILKKNNGKSGVYCWKNKENEDFYIGSSTDLEKRLKYYCSLSYLKNEKKNKSIIYKSLLKYGYSKFSLQILEYCEPSDCIKKEQYYIDLLKPKYNILKTAGSSLGFKHSEETLAKLSAAQKKVDRLVAPQ